MYALSCHALVNDLPPSESASILCALETMLSRKYQIRHTTIQFECHPHQERYCSVNGLYCHMEAAKTKQDASHDHSPSDGNPTKQKG